MSRTVLEDSLFAELRAMEEKIAELKRSLNSVTTVANTEDGRMVDQRVPLDGSVTDAKVAPLAGIAESKLALASDTVASIPSRRTLGTGANQAAAGNDARFNVPQQITTVGALPGSPTNGQLVIYQNDPSAPYLWMLRYNSSSISAYKWEFVGGSPIIANVTAVQTTASTTYTNLATTGPTVSLTLAGEYMVRHGALISNNTVAFTIMSYSIGANAASDNDSLSQVLAINEQTQPARTIVHTIATAGATIQGKYRVTAGTGTFSSRWIEVLPVRVG